MTAKNLELLQEQASAGSASAFGQLVRHLDSDLRGVVWAVVRSSDATNDVMQTAYEKAFSSIHNFDGRSSIKTWLHSICYRAALDYVRYEGRRRHENVDDLSTAAAAGSVADEVIARGQVGAGFEMLNTEQRVILFMTAGLGFTFDEVAELTGISRGTVASRAGRAKAKLRKELTR